jgi:predicted ATPase/DNA-binding winged helix-turn-helix (wHTH) protein
MPVDQSDAISSLQPPRYRCGDVEVDAGRHVFARGGAEIPLEPKVFAVVLMLLARPGTLVTREQLLDSVWGHRYVTPSTLNRVIALARRAFGDNAQAPRFIDTVHGTGYRYVGPVDRQSTSLAEAARFGPPPMAQLPARVEPIVGRERELEILGTLLGESRALTVVGIGGMGKTKCALECARRVASTFPDGVWFLDLAALQDADGWVNSLAAALAVRAGDDTPTMSRIVAALANRKALLVLDNCDRIAGDLGPRVHALLVGASEVRVLATSQRALRFLGERVVRMPPMALPELPRDGAINLATLATTPAMALLLTRVRHVEPAFTLTQENAAALVEICVRLDGMPLALELAAARFALLSPAQILERLDRRFRFLTSDAAGRDERHRNLQALLEWSYGLLSDGERRLLAWLGVFVRGWSMESAIGIAGILGHDPESAVELLSGLVDKSLVSVDGLLAPPRYRLLETVRAFALDRLADAGESVRARDAHVTVLRSLATDAHRDILAGGMTARLEALAADFPNIEAAVDHALGRDHDAALEIAGSLLLYMKGRGAVVAGIPLCRRVLEATSPAPTRARGRALLAFGVNGMPFADVDASAALSAAASAARASGDRWGETYAEASRGMLLAASGAVGEAGEAVDTAVTLAAGLADPVLDGAVALARGWLRLAQGHTREAIDALLPVRRVGADLHQHHFIEIYLGLAQFRLGESVAAAASWLQGMRMAIPLGHVRGAAGGIEGAAYIEANAGRAREAALLLGAAQAIRARTIPLYRWWHDHHAAALAAVTAVLGDAVTADYLSEGARLREEDAIEAAALALERHMDSTH